MNVIFYMNKIFNNAKAKNRNSFSIIFILKKRCNKVSLMIIHPLELFYW